ncbi:NAD(P)-binding domain-containing protein, partial [Enterococcus faecalis]|uniref:NAD(P)-binding domain-containing protein n=1 Tax=Enterococcus faecalis TaxID=1351 RepID=UPI00403F27F9
MGYPMAGHLAKRGGHALTVYNRTAAKSAAWVQAYGAGRSAATPADAAREAQFVFCCVGNDDDLRQVTVGPQGAFQTMRPGT